jgi:hypothetical protein
MKIRAVCVHGVDKGGMKKVKCTHMGRTYLSVDPDPVLS